MAAVCVEAYNVWMERPKYDEAENSFYESAKKVSWFSSFRVQSILYPLHLKQTSLTPLADEVAKARQRLMEVKGSIGEVKIRNCIWVL